MSEKASKTLAVQTVRPERMDGKTFLRAVAGIVLRLAVCQVLVNLLIRASGVGLLNLLFYAYAVALLWRFMRRAVGGCVYALTEEHLILSRKMGDSTTSVVELPLSEIDAARPARWGEDWRLNYRQVTVIDPKLAPSFRIRMARATSLFSARLARKIAGAQAERPVGLLIACREGNGVRCCVFAPDEAYCTALQEKLGERFGWDDRFSRPRLVSIRARCLNRAFPDCMPNVEPLIGREAAAWAQEKAAEEAEQRRVKAAKREAKQASQRADEEHREA